MIRTIFITLTLFIVTCFQAKSQVNFESGDFSSALAKAKVEKKKVFIDCYTSWCGPCKMLATKVFPDPKVGDFMNNEFINIKFDMEKGEGIDLCKKFKVNAFPTLLILDSNGSEINRLVGASEDIESFISSIKNASKVETSLTELKKRYEADINLADDYLNAVCSRGIPEETETALKEVFVRRTPTQRYAASSFKIYQRAIKTIDEKTAELIINDRENAIKYLGQEKYDNFIESKVSEKVVALYMGDTKIGVTIDKCASFEKFAGNYPDILNSTMFKYFAATYKYASNREVDKFLEVSLNFYADANMEMKKSIQRFSYRLAVTSGKKEAFERFSEECKKYPAPSEDKSKANPK